MSNNYSIEREIENQITQLFIDYGPFSLFAGQFYTSISKTAREVPYILVTARLNQELLQQYTGLYRCSVTISYVAQVLYFNPAPEDSLTFDSTYQEIVQLFYTSPSIADQMTNASAELNFSLSNITTANPLVISQNRNWRKDITLDIIATSK